MTERVTKTIRLDAELSREVEEIMAEQNRTFSNLAAVIFKEYVDNWKKEQKKDEQ